MSFQWIPHRGISKRAIARMKRHFKKPAHDPHEAWFMSATPTYYGNLIESLTMDKDLKYIEHVLFDLCGGVKNFGRFQEWVDWYHYLLPYVLENVFEGGFEELCINYCINLYRDGIHEEYPGFRQDILQTLGRIIMSHGLWDKRDLAKGFYYDEWEGYDDSLLCAEMFFCLMYLTPNEIATWVQSVADIPGTLWLEQISRWLTNATRFFHYIERPDEIPDQLVLSIGELANLSGIGWWRDYLVFSNTAASADIWGVIPKENAEIFWQEVKKYPQLKYVDYAHEN